MNNLDRAYEIIDKTLPIAHEFAAYADLLKAIAAALDEKDKLLSDIFDALDAARRKASNDQEETADSMLDK